MAIEEQQGVEREFLRGARDFSFYRKERKEALQILLGER